MCIRDSRCTDGGEIWRGGGDSVPNFTPPTSFEPVCDQLRAGSNLLEAGRRQVRTSFESDSVMEFGFNLADDAKRRYQLPLRHAATPTLKLL